MLSNLKIFHVKTKIFAGRGAVSNLGAIAEDFRAHRCLLVADPELDHHGIIDKVKASLRKSGIQVEASLKVEPEPYLDNADEAASMGREMDAELVVGLGGGSAMDTAKAAATILTNGGKAEDYIGLNKAPKPTTPTIMIPTTAGTGSEVTFTAVFTNRMTNVKGGINSPFLFPDVAVLDPELTLSLPPSVTAFTGMDALTHAIESVTSRSATIFTEALSFTAIRLISESLRRAVYNGSDIEAREKMLLGSLFGGLALADAGVGAAHALAYPLGGNYRTPHGLANAILIPHVMEFNLPAAENSLALIAKNMGESVEGLSSRWAAQTAVDAVRILASDIGVPETLYDLGIPKSDIPTLVESALKVTRPVENNPRFLGSSEARLIYEAAFGQ
ncbi:MAG: iron-containing alcohol dehydrogenase [Desulfomonilaceae bacterium]